MLYHERERKNKEKANFVYIVYLLTKLSNIFDEALFIDVSIYALLKETTMSWWNSILNQSSTITEGLRVAFADAKNRTGFLTMPLN